MNQIIKDLAEQCGFKSNPDIYDRNQSFDIPKFARLVAEECSEIALAGKAIAVSTVIKDRFGVE